MDADLTIPEACALLNPPIPPRQLRALITALGWQPTGMRLTGKAGQPHPTYPWAKIDRLHTAITWLNNDTADPIG